MSLDVLRGFRFRDYGLSLVWVIVTLGTALTLFLHQYNPNFINDFATLIRLAVIGLSFAIYGTMALFYYDAYADVREGIARPDVTVERFIVVIGTITLIIGTSLDMMSRLDQNTSWRVPIYLFGYVILLYGFIKRNHHYTKPLFPASKSDER
jgi:hypothetical protein